MYVLNVKKETTSGNIWRVVGTTINIRASVFTELFRYSLIFKLHCYVEKTKKKNIFNNHPVQMRVQLDNPFNCNCECCGCFPRRRGRPQNKFNVELNCLFLGEYSSQRTIHHLNGNYCN